VQIATLRTALCQKFQLEATMRGPDRAERCKRREYSIQTLMLKLGIGPRQSINNWEKADKVPDLPDLALYALEHCPEYRRAFEQIATKVEPREYFSKRYSR
jgi:hypothetical protein